jgi:hypothetical protein
MIVVSELVADGVQHGGNDEIALRVAIEGHYLYVEVTTALGADVGRPITASEARDDGSGLALVASCCDAMEARDDRSGYHHVTCVIGLARPR